MSEYSYIHTESIYQYFGKENPELVKELVTLIIEVNLEELRSLPDFYQQKDYATIKKRVHKSKPSLGYIGATKTLPLIRSIEAEPENSLENIQNLLEHIEHISSELKSFLARSYKD